MDNNELKRKAYKLETCCIIMGIVCGVLFVMFLAVWSNSVMWKSEYEFYKGKYDKLQQKEFNYGLMGSTKSPEAWAKEYSQLRDMTAYKLKLEGCEVVRDAYAGLIESYKDLIKVQSE